MSTRIALIHEVNESILNLDLSYFDIITFDDGLYSQFKNVNHFLKFNKPLYFFISTDIICPEDLNQIEDIQCSEAHKKYFENNDKSSYMKLSQIKELSKKNNCFIGGHSHTHRRLKNKSLKEQYSLISEECNNMINYFKENNIIIDSFAYPYNEELTLYKGVLNKNEIFKIFGKERENIK